MLITIVLIAEALVFVWFTVFSLMLLSMYLDSRGMPLPKLDVAGRTLMGIVALAAMTVFEIQALS